MLESRFGRQRDELRLELERAQVLEPPFFVTGEPARVPWHGHESSASLGPARPPGAAAPGKKRAPTPPPQQPPLFFVNGGRRVSFRPPPPVFCGPWRGFFSGLLPPCGGCPRGRLPLCVRAG